MLRKILAVLMFGFLPMVSSAQFNLAFSPGLAAPASGCELSGTSSIVVTVVNMGSSSFFPPNSFTLSYSLNGGPLVSETVTVSFPFAPSSTYIYTFSQQADLSGCQVHTLDFSVVASIPEVNTANNYMSTTVTSDCAAVAGYIVAPDTVCSGLNSGNMTLSGSTGNVVDWIYTIDGGSSWTWAMNPSATQPYSNINTQMEWWVLMGSPYGYCPNDSSAHITINTIPQTWPGTLPADFDICDNGNGGAINVTGFTGDILGWEYSDDFGSTWTPIASTNDSIWYDNLTDTISYHVEVKNGICPAMFSAPVILTLIPGSDAGDIIGELLVCNYENDSSLEINPVTGSIVDWNISTDNGTTWVGTGVSDTLYEYNGLLNYTVFAVLVQEGNCPYDTAFHSIVVLPLAISAGTDISIFEEDSTQLSASGGSFFTWFPDYNMSDAGIYNPIVWPEVTTTYNVAISDINGCTDTASVTITVMANLSEIIVPNLITPNADSYNDILVIQNIETYPNNEIVIFNGYGQVVYQSSPYNNDWDATFGGTVIPDGTYFYVLDLHDPVLAPEPFQGVITIMSND